MVDFMNFGVMGRRIEREERSQDGGEEKELRCVSATVPCLSVVPEVVSVL